MKSHLRKFAVIFALLLIGEKLYADKFRMQLPHPYKVTKGEAELSLSPDFSTVDAQGSFNEKGYATLELELEKTYYWRITIGDKTAFKGVLFTPLLSPSKKFSWQGFDSDDDNYRIREYDLNQNRIQSASTNGRSIIFERDFQNLKYLVPLKGDKDILRPESLPAIETRAVNHPVKPGSNASEISVSPETSEKPKEAPPPKPLPKLIRDSQVSIGMKIFREEFTVTRELAYESPETMGMGSAVSGSFFHKFYALAFDFDSHGTDTDYDGGEDSPRSLQKRSFFNMRLGVDLLNIATRHESHALILSPGFNMGRYPIFEDDQSFQSTSIYLEYIYFSDYRPTKVTLSSSENLKLIKIEKHWPINNGLDFSVGLYQKKQNMEASGASSEFSESGLTLGLSLVIQEPREIE